MISSASQSPNIIANPQCAVVIKILCMCVCVYVWVSVTTLAPNASFVRQK